MAATISQPEHEEHQLCNSSSKFEPWKPSFYAGTQVQPSKTMAQRLPKRGRRVRTIPQERSVNKAKIRRLLAQPDGLKRIHRRELPPEPKTHGDLDTHLLGDEFRKAEQDHLQSHVPMNSWSEVSRSDPEVKGHQILDCMWVGHLSSRLVYPHIGLPTASPSASLYHGHLYHGLPDLCVPPVPAHDCDHDPLPPRWLHTRIPKVLAEGSRRVELFWVVCGGQF